MRTLWTTIGIACAFAALLWGASSLGQAEPNGLYMPDSAEATWVMCSDGKGGVAPVYSEPRLIVSPFPLGHVDAAENSGFDDKVSIQRLNPGGAKIQPATKGDS